MRNQFVKMLLFLGAVVTAASALHAQTAGTFAATGSMTANRKNHTATLLSNGKVLIAGGYNGSSYLSSAELYDPATGTFTVTGSMTAARGDQTATLLGNGKVLIAGGYNGSSYLSSAELYDPATGTFTATGSMTAARRYHTATLLGDGKVLIAGGYDGSSYLSSAEFYDPATGTSTATGNMMTGRIYQGATLLGNGKVLIAGGYNGSTLSSAELYNPTTGTFIATGSMTSGRQLHSGMLLGSGKVLIAGGYNLSTGSYLSSAELYDPSAGTFSATGSMASPRQWHTATLLGNGNVLIAGGYNCSSTCSYLSSAELYNATAGTFTATGSMTAGRANQTATLLVNGKVLIAGGYNGATLISAELYTPTYGKFALTGNMTTPRDRHTATVLGNGKVLIAGGYNGSSYLSSAELYDPATGTFTATGNMPPPTRQYHTATLLGNGKVLIAGGYNGAYLNSAVLYDPSAGTFTTTGSMVSTRENHTATLLSNGKVLITGGYNGSYLYSAELYDPSSGTFTATGNMQGGRAYHTATLLSNGEVLIAGGYSGGSLNSASLYDPSTGTFTATGSMTIARAYHTATPLGNGKVLVAGGINGSTYLASAELYDPSAGTFAATGNMTYPRLGHAGGILNNGKVLITGGYTSTLSVSNSADIYDPSAGTFAATGSMQFAREIHTLTLLNNSSVLISGGLSNSNIVQATAEIYLIPQISTVSQTSGAVGAPITVTGSGFGANQGAGMVLFNGTIGMPSSWSDTSIVVPVPVGATTGNVVVIAGGLTSNGVSFAVGQPPSITGMGPVSGAVDTPVTITGTNFGATQGAASWVKIGTVTVAPTSWVDNEIKFTVPAGMGTGAQSVVVKVETWPEMSAGTFTVIPGITGMSPTSGAVDTPVTITGTNFGATQGAASWVKIGTVTVAPTSWKDNEIKFSVPDGMGTGAQSVVVKVETWPEMSAGTFTVIVLPTITSSISPTPNVSGWNNWDTTVTFTCTPGTLAISSCTAPQTVSVEGAGQIVTGTATDSGGNTATTSVTINLDKTKPFLAVTSPVEGQSFTASPVAVSGTLTDPLSGAATVTCNGAPAMLVNSDFSCDVSLTSVGLNLISVMASDVAGNMAGYSLHVSLAGSLPAPTTLKITPESVNLVVGQTTGFSAVDELGRPRTDATWVVSDVNVATITADSSPLLTPVAVGQVTLTANVGSVSAQAQVNILSGTTLPMGTVIWTSPPPTGFIVQQVVQAEPVQGAPDIYSFESDSNQNTFVRALSGDGRQKWTAQLGPGTYSSVMPDSNGGILVFGHDFNAGNDWLVDLDGQTGMRNWRKDFSDTYYYTTLKSLSQNTAIRGDGTVFSVGGFQLSPGLFGFDGVTGAQLSYYLGPPSTTTVTGQCGYTATTYNTIAPRISIGPDNAVYAVAVYGDYVATDDCNFYIPQSMNRTMSLVRVAEDGTTTLTPFRNDTSIQNSGDTNPFKPIPDGQGGVLIYYSLPIHYQGSISYEPHLARVSSTGQTTDFTLSSVAGTPNEVALGENNVAFANYYGQTVAALNIDTGATVWTYTESNPGSALTVVAASAGGGLVVNDSAQGLIALDASGVPTVVGTGVVNQVSPAGLGRWFADPSLLTGPSVGVADTDYPESGGNGASQNTSPKLATVVFVPRNPTDNSSDPNFGTTQNVANYFQKNLSKSAVDLKTYIMTGNYLATFNNFDAEVVTEMPHDVLGFIGDSMLASCASATDPYCSYSIGISFVDYMFIRTPNCLSFGLCYGLDASTQTSVNPDGSCPDGYALYTSPDGTAGCYQGMFPPCNVGSEQIGTLCYKLPVGKNNLPAKHRDPLITSAKVVFIAACKTRDVFSSWWEMNFASPSGGRALVVPDIDLMASLDVNATVAPQYQGLVDLVQGAEAYKAFVDSLSKGKTVQQAVGDTNARLAVFYQTLVYPSGGQLPLVAYKVIGNSGWCRRCK